MFSPHQVTIERDETISDEEFFKEHEEKERNEEESNSINRMNQTKNEKMNQKLIFIVS